MAQNNDFSGKWHFCHWYPSSDDSTEEKGEYEMTAHQTGDLVVLESDKGTEHGAYMLVRLKINDRVATGSWHEDAALDGPFKGVQYSGAGQLVVDQDGDYMDGMWAGVGFDHAASKPRVYTGRWELKRLGH